MNRRSCESDEECYHCTIQIHTIFLELFCLQTKSKICNVNVPKMTIIVSKTVRIYTMQNSNAQNSATKHEFTRVFDTSALSYITNKLCLDLCSLTHFPILYSCQRKGRE